MKRRSSGILGFALFGIVANVSLGCSGEDASATGGSSSEGGGGASGSTSSTSSSGGAGSTVSSTGSGSGSRGPAYDAGTASCPADDGVRRIKLVNNCADTRWFKLDGRTTPTWARSKDCAWAGAACSDPESDNQCSKIAKDKAGGADPGTVYCKANDGGGSTCACNPYFELKPGQEHVIDMPADAAFPSGTGWMATGCNPNGSGCEVGNEAAKNSTFEFTYDPPGKGTLWYDISAVNAWTSASSVGMKSCGGGQQDPKDVFWCRGTGCRFDVQTQCPDGSDGFAPAPAGCKECPTMIEKGKKVIVGSCGTCPDGNSANRVPTGTVFNAYDPAVEWTWQGSPEFAQGFGANEGTHANRRYACGPAGCAPAEAGKANTCLGGCDLCTITQGADAQNDKCLKYCCPDVTRTYGGATYRYDSAGCTALGVQAGTDYTPAVKGECPYVYTYGYEDHSSTFKCGTSASLLIQACPDPTDFPSSLTP